MSWFGFIGGIIQKAFGLAKASGLTDDLVQLALKWVRQVADQTVEKAEKREIVVKVLVARGVPESIARIATELAYQLWKKEVGSKISAK